MYTPKFFQTYELVPQDVYTKYGDFSLCFFDDRILIVADAVRNFFSAPVTINNWKSGGPFSQRGLRNVIQPGSSQYEPHARGAGIDFDVLGHSADEVRNSILANLIYPGFQFIRGMERNTNWVHLDTANRQGNGVYQFDK